MKIGKTGSRIFTGLCVGAAVLTSSILRNRHSDRSAAELPAQIYKDEYVGKSLKSQMDSIVKAKTDSIANLTVSKAVTSAVKDTVPSKSYFDATQLLGDSIKNVVKAVK